MLSRDSSRHGTPRRSKRRRHLPVLQSASPNLTLRHIGDGAYEARRLMPPQNLGHRGTLWKLERAFPEFLPSNAVRPQVVAFCGIKNTQKSTSAGASPRTPVFELTSLLRPSCWWGGGLAAPPPKKNPYSLPGPFGARASALRSYFLRTSSCICECVSNDQLIHKIVDVQ